MVYVRNYDAYMRRFFRHATEQGAARVTGGNTLVAACQDEWDFLLDPARIGEDTGWWRTDTRGPNWQRLKTSSLSWSDQGHRYYKGLAWYRQTVTVAPEHVGKRIFLWCGGVDELAKVWVNGTPIGISHGAAIYPFELDATEAVKAGENSIVICVRNGETAVGA
jgi:beta-galactosidase/beta-glucuronidase